MHHRAELMAGNTERGKQIGVEIAGLEVQHLRCRCNGEFSHGIAGEHVGQCIGDEQDFVGTVEYRSTVLAQCE